MNTIYPIKRAMTTTIDDKNKNLSLSNEEFEQLVSDLQNGDHRLFNNIIKNAMPPLRHILRKNYPTANDDDLKEALLRAIEDFWKRITDQKIEYGNLRSLLELMARQHYLKIIKANRNLTDLPNNFDVPDLDLGWISSDIWNKFDAVFDAFCEKHPVCGQLFRDTFFKKTRVTDLLNNYNCRDANAFGKKKSDCLKKMRSMFFK